MLRKAALIAAIACAGPLAAQNQSGLLGRTVQFNVLTYDKPDAPLLSSQNYIAVVADGPEFGMIRESGLGLAVVPVLIDVDRKRVILSYENNQAGAFYRANFNGYVMQFLTDCVLIAGATLDLRGTTMPMTDKNLIVTPQSLSINVSGLSYTPDDRIVVDVDVLDCPTS